MKITIVCFGKLKNKALKDLEKEYLKRLSYNITIKEIKEESIPSQLSDTQIKQLQQKETKKALEYAKGKKIFLDEKGKQHTSLAFAKFIKKQEEQSNITFIIGPPLGFDKTLLEKEEKIALSSMTFTHEMAKVFLLEQIYRAESINKGKKYHKE